MTPDNFRQAVPFRMCFVLRLTSMENYPKKSLLKWFCTACTAAHVRACIGINLLLSHASINLMNFGSELLFCNTQKPSFTFFQIEQINC